MTETDYRITYLVGQLDELRIIAMACVHRGEQDRLLALLHKMHTVNLEIEQLNWRLQRETI